MIGTYLISIGTFYSTGDADNFAFLLNLDRATNLNNINWQRTWQGYKGVSLTEVDG